MRADRERPGFTAGVLVANLGTPDAPDTPALKRYLAEFLSDSRVIELPRWKWQPILRGIVLPRRAAKSAAAYREVWTEEGSPLLATARRQAAGLAARLEARLPGRTRVALGMRYGNPSIAAALEQLLGEGCDGILLLPLYPQYSATTTASTFDALTGAMQRLRRVPALRTVHSYHDDPGYVRALAASLREAWAAGGEPERLLFSFHGIPERYARAGDPYPEECQKTARLVADELELPADRWQLAFQSRFGREEWLRPYTDETLRAWGKAGLAGVDVICPGFSADCLETIEEIDRENRAYFEQAGGGRFRYIPALNDRADHLDALAALAARHLAGWIPGNDGSAAG